MEEERRDSEVDTPTEQNSNPINSEKSTTDSPEKLLDKQKRRIFIINVILLLLGFFSFFIVAILICFQVVLIPTLYPYSIIPLFLYSLLLFVIGIVFQNTKTQKIIFICHVFVFLFLNLLFENLNYFLFLKYLAWPYFLAVTLFLISFHLLIFTKSILGESLHFVFYHCVTIGILNIKNHFTDSTTQLILLIISLAVYLLWTIIWVLHIMIYRLILSCCDKKEIKEERDTEETLIGDPEVEKQRRRARNTKILLEKNAML